MTSPVNASDHLGAVPVTDISCPDDGDKVVADDIRVAVAALLANDDAQQTNITNLGNDKVAKAGDTMTGALILNAGATVASGQDLALNGANVTGVVGFSTLGRVWLAGRKQLIRTRVALTDADATINVDQGDRFELPVVITPTRIITLDKVGVVPENGETITVFWYLKGTASGNSTYLSFRRNDGTVICTFKGSAVCNVDLLWAEFEYVAGVWRLGKCAGTMYDGAALFGVIAGAGA
jgi:hypothetical protein